MGKKICITIMTMLMMFLVSPTAIHAEDEETTTWTDENGNVYEVEHTQVLDQSIENGKYMPSSVTGQKFEGTGTVVDFVQTDTKTFYTIYTADDKIYYLIIDNTKDNNNVYFLREINEDELNFGYQYEVVNNNKYAEDEVVQVEKKEKTNMPDTKTLVICGGLVAAALVFFIVNKVKNKKPKAPKDSSINSSISDDLVDDMYGNENEDFSSEDDFNLDEDVFTEDQVNPEEIAEPSQPEQSQEETESSSNSQEPIEQENTNNDSNVEEN